MLSCVFLAVTTTLAICGILSICILAYETKNAIVIDAYGDIINNIKNNEII